MKIEIKRVVRTEAYTAGRLHIDGKYFCDTLEPPEREVKVHGNTAIPYGFYRITLDVVSPRFSKSQTYASIGARLPRVLEVPGFDGILIHPGNTVRDTAGCILVGRRGQSATLYDSRKIFFALYAALADACAEGEELELTIVGGE